MAITGDGGRLREVAPGVFLYESTCNVYVLQDGDQAILIDFGDGAILDVLASMGLRATDVLMTHHHRDQGQGLHRAQEAGVRIWAPHAEVDLFASIDARWQGREILNNYNMRQDRFSLLKQVRAVEALRDYRTYRFGRFEITVVPTPGHTPGSITLMTECGGQKLAFTGDLIYGPGKVWSLSAMQWTYNGSEGVHYSILSLLDLKDRGPDLLFPSHGAPMREPNAAIDLLVKRLWEIPKIRGRQLDLFEWREQPYVALTPHLLLNRTSISRSYVLLSKSGKALLIDYGYDMAVGVAYGTDHAGRRPWLYSIPALKAQFGVKRIDAALLTHFHDDHVAGLNMLREVEGTEVWAGENFAALLENPTRYDLPCLWFEPIPVDRKILLEQSFTWEEYTFTLYPQPGHTHYAVAIYFEVDGHKVLATGDQQGNEGTLYNYVYHNGFHHGDYKKSAELYRRLAPDLMIGGHWEPMWVNKKYLDDLQRYGEALERAHVDLLPFDEVDLGTEGFGVRLLPYQASVKAGGSVAIEAHVINPFAHAAKVNVELAVPAGWRAEPAVGEIELEGKGTGIINFTLHAPSDWPTAGLDARRVRIAADLTVADRRFGQHAEALVNVV